MRVQKPTGQLEKLSTPNLISVNNLAYNARNMAYDAHNEAYAAHNRANGVGAQINR